MIKKIFDAYLWLVPFAIFFLSFLISFFFFSHEKKRVPCLLYKTTTEALALLADEELNCRLLKQQESNWPSGTVIAQSPQAGKPIKAFQTVFVTIAQAPLKIVPIAVGLSRGRIQKTFDSTHKIQWSTIYSPSLCGYCFAQINTPEKIILYESSEKNRSVLMPSFNGIKVRDAQEFLNKYSIKHQIIHIYSVSSNHKCSSCTISGQHPQEGTIISLETPPIIQLKI